MTSAAGTLTLPLTLGVSVANIGARTANRTAAISAAAMTTAGIQ